MAEKKGSDGALWLTEIKNGPNAGKLYLRGNFEVVLRGEKIKVKVRVFKNDRKDPNDKESRHPDYHMFVDGDGSEERKDGEHR